MVLEECAFKTCYWSTLDLNITPDYSNSTNTLLEHNFGPKSHSSVSISHLHTRTCVNFSTSVHSFGAHPTNSCFNPKNGLAGVVYMASFVGDRIWHQLLVTLQVVSCYTAGRLCSLWLAVAAWNEPFPDPEFTSNVAIWGIVVWWLFLCFGFRCWSLDRPTGN